MRKTSHVLSVLLSMTAVLAMSVPMHVSANDSAPFEILGTETCGTFEVFHVKPTETLVKPPPLRATGGTNELGLTESQMKSLKSDLRTAIANKTEIIDISKYYIPYDLSQSDLFVSLVGEDPLNITAEIDGFYSHTLSNKKYLFGLKMVYYTDEEVSQIQAAADKMLAGLDSPALSDTEKALLLHDRLALNCEYDVENLQNDTLPDESYQAYGALVNRICVCEGYAKAYMYMMNRLGIHTEFIDSKTLNHAWNVVTIDGKRYHVDVEHDDPTPNLVGRALHDNFLLSSQALYAGSSHKATDYDQTLTDTTYDTAVWSDIATNFVLFEDEIYYITADGSLNCLEDGTPKQVLSLKDHFTDNTWYANDLGSYWQGFHSMLSCDNEALYFNLAKNIYRYVPNETSATVFYTPAETKTAIENSIYRFRAADGIFEYVISTTPNQIQNYPILHKAYEAMFIEQSATLSGEIGMNFCMQLTNAAKTTDAYMEFNVAGLNGKQTIIPLSDITPDDAGHYIFTCTVNALQMADEITAIYHYGTDQSVTFTSSVKEYIENVAALASKGDTTCQKALPLVKALADYGYYAQQALAAEHGFTIGTDHAEMIRYTTAPDISADLSAYAFSQNGNAESIGAEKITKTLALDSRTDLIVFFAMQDGNSLTEADISCSTAYPTEFLQTTDDRYCFIISDIGADALDDTFCIDVKNGALTLEISALSYADAVLSGTASAADKNACAALYAYYLAAENYLK